LFAAFRGYRDDDNHKHHHAARDRGQAFCEAFHLSLHVAIIQGFVALHEPFPRQLTLRLV
jgi:hypothetical protein